MDAAGEDLQHCRRELFRLLNENAALRYAAMSFGDLAERLNLIVTRYKRHGLLPAAFPDPDSGARTTEHTMAKNPETAATPGQPQRTDDYSATTAPENREHVESRLASLDEKLHPGGARSVPEDPGMGNLHRSDVPGLDPVEKPLDGRPAGNRSD